MATVSHSCSYIKNGVLFSSSPACLVLVDITEFDSLTMKLRDEEWNCISKNQNQNQFEIRNSQSQKGRLYYTSRGYRYFSDHSILPIPTRSFRQRTAVSTSQASWARVVIVSNKALANTACGAWVQATMFSPVSTTMIRIEMKSISYWWNLATFVMWFMH